jgi:hypothetical protein
MIGSSGTDSCPPRLVIAVPLVGGFIVVELGIVFGRSPEQDVRRSAAPVEKSVEKSRRYRIVTPHPE